MSFDWATARAAFEDFGGDSVTLRVQKTGLPFFDALRLYGAIDLYIGLREETSIHDAGAEWVVEGLRRKHRVQGRALKAVQQVWKKKTPSPAELSLWLDASVTSAPSMPSDPSIKVLNALRGVDAALQAGIRGTSASSYATLETSQASAATCCVADIPVSQGVLAFAGKARTETAGNVVFLPIFEGRIDFAKIVSPLRAWLSSPHVLCAQALVLLSLKASLFAEGYQDRLTAVAFTTSLDSRKHANYSGLVTVSSTAIGRIRSPGFAAHLTVAYRELVRAAWRRGRATPEEVALRTHALSTTFWLMQPVRKNVSAMLTAQEHLRFKRKRDIFAERRWAREVFEMTYGDWQGDHEAVRAFARATASAIYHARMKDRKTGTDARKAWYDEVVMLRSSPSPKVFMERVLILLEQGHREHSGVATHHRREDFDPKPILKNIRDGCADFETFRDLFRMYLLQESTWGAKAPEVSASDGEESEDVAPGDDHQANEEDNE